MDSLLHRYRNITVLFVAILAQLGAIAWQVKRDDNVSLLRIWAVSAVTPMASLVENLRTGTFGVFTDYFAFRGTRDESRSLRADRDRLRLENQLLKNELAAAQREEGLAGFRAHTPSKMIAARVIGATTGLGTRSVLIDQGTVAGVQRGMAVVTPDGIVGRVLAAYPLASLVLSVTDAGFAASVETQKNHTRGVLKGMGSSTARIDYVPGGQKVEPGEAFYTSGDDRVFPRGMPAGRVVSVHEGGTFLEILAEPFSGEAAPEAVFVIVDPVHQEIPEVPITNAPVFLGPDAPSASGASGGQSGGNGTTQADQLMDQYRKIGAAQGHVFGGGNVGSTPPNFNLKVPGVNAPGVAVPVPGVAPGASGGTGFSGRAVRAVAGVVAHPATGARFGSGMPRIAIGGSGVRRVVRPVSASGGLRLAPDVPAKGGTQP